MTTENPVPDKRTLRATVLVLAPMAIGLSSRSIKHGFAAGRRGFWLVLMISCQSRHRLKCRPRPHGLRWDRPRTLRGRLGDVAIHYWGLNRLAELARVGQAQAPCMEGVRCRGCIPGRHPSGSGFSRRSRKGNFQRTLV